MRITELHNQPVEADTYEASMALNQLLKIGKHAIKIHNMIDDSAEMEAWVAKKIDLAGDYVKKVHGYMQGEKAGLYDDGGMSEMKKMPKGTGTMQGVKEDAGSLTDQQKKGLDMINKKYGNRVGGNLDSLPMGYIRSRMDTGIFSDGIDDEELEALLKKHGHESVYDAEDADVDFWEKTYNKQNLPITFAMIDDLEKVLGPAFHDEEKLGVAGAYIKSLSESVSEDAGEGHMSKSTLYHTAKYAIALMDMIKPGDDLEGWVQSKLNKAADYLQGVHNYEEYQKLNPYREELDSNTLQKHAQVVQKNIDEILARETKLNDVDTKPGMMRILAKRVNEVEKEMAKENRKNTDEAHGGEHSTSGRNMTKGEMNKREKIVKGMKKNKAGFKKRYGKDAEAVMYATATKNAMKDVKEQPSGIGRAIGTAARSLGAKAAGKLGMKKTAAGLQGRVNVDKKSKELDTALAQYLGTQRADKNRIEPKVLQGFLAQQGIDQKYMQYVKGPINQQQVGKLIDKISADGFAGQFQRQQPNVPGDKGQDQKVQQRATQFKNVVGAKGTSPAMTAKGIGALAKGDRPQPNQLKQIAPYAAQLQKIMADPKLAQRFRQLLQMANRQQTVTADVDESGIMYKAGVKKYGKDGMRKIQSAAGKGASHQEIGKIKDKYIKDEEQFDEGLKDWAKSLAMAGVLVAGMAGIGSIQNAIDNSVPAVQAMNTAYEMAVDQGNDELAKMIKNDLSAVKVRLSSGKDLNFVKSMQDKYSKFIQTEALAYESKLAIMLNQQLK